RRYLPARGTAGLARSFVSGYSLDPTPPPRTTASTSCIRISNLLLHYPRCRLLPKGITPPGPSLSINAALPKCVNPKVAPSRTLFHLAFRRPTHSLRPAPFL